MGKTPPDPDPEVVFIDPLDKAALTYIALKFNCTVADVILAIETTKSHERVTVYTWLRNYTLSGG